MRIDCKHYESRTYASGEVVRMCRLDLAPDAPWKCPEDCSGYARRVIDAGWTVGTLGTVDTPAGPPPDVDAAALLDAAEDIINAVGPEIVAEVRQERAERDRPRRWWQRFRRR